MDRAATPLATCAADAHLVLADRRRLARYRASTSPRRCRRPRTRSRMSSPIRLVSRTSPIKAASLAVSGRPGRGTPPARPGRARARAALERLSRAASPRPSARAGSWETEVENAVARSAESRRSSLLIGAPLGPEPWAGLDRAGHEAAQQPAKPVPCGFRKRVRLRRTKPSIRIEWGREQRARRRGRQPRAEQAALLGVQGLGEAFRRPVAARRAARLRRGSRPRPAAASPAGQTASSPCPPRPSRARAAGLGEDDLDARPGSCRPARE